MDIYAWPSDDNDYYYQQRSSTRVNEKINMVEFYHKILWASQHLPYDENDSVKTNNNDDDTGRRRKVTFSPDPPEIYEYEPEYNTPNSLSAYLRHKLHPQQPYSENGYRPLVFDSMEKDEVDFCNRALAKSRSLTDFKPIPNQQFKESVIYSDFSSLVDTSMQLDLLLSPPPSYKQVGETIIKESLDQNDKKLKKKLSFIGFWPSNKNTNDDGNNNAANLEQQQKQQQPFLQRALRKIKSSPRLMISRRASVVSLHKKASFLGA